MPSGNWTSSSLQDILYDHELALLDVVFRNGDVYRYFNVPARIHQQLLEAESKGRFYNFQIRNHFSFARILSASQPPTQIPTPSLNLKRDSLVDR